MMMMMMTIVIKDNLSWLMLIFIVIVVIALVPPCLFLLFLSAGCVRNLRLLDYLIERLMQAPPEDETSSPKQKQQRRRRRPKLETIVRNCLRMVRETRSIDRQTAVAVHPRALGRLIGSISLPPGPL